MAEEVFLCSNMLEPDEGLGHLYLMDVDEPGDTMVIEHTIGYAASMGMGLLSEIDTLWTSVSISTILFNYVKGLTILVIVSYFRC